MKILIMIILINLVNNLPLKCTNCNKGFFANENNSKSCSFHINYYNNDLNIWQCCGKADRENPVVLQGVKNLGKQTNRDN